MVFISNIPHKKRLYNLIFIKTIKTPCLIYGFKKISTIKNEIPKKSL